MKTATKKVENILPMSSFICNKGIQHPPPAAKAHPHPPFLRKWHRRLGDEIQPEHKRAKYEETLTGAQIHPLLWFFDRTIDASRGENGFGIH